MQIVLYRVRFEYSINLPYRRINKQASAANNFSSFEGASTFFFYLLVICDYVARYSINSRLNEASSLDRAFSTICFLPVNRAWRIPQNADDARFLCSRRGESF